MISASRKQSYDFSALSILIVDDSDHMLAIVRRLLTAMRIEQLRTAHEIESALDAMRVSKPDLIILDWNMIPTNGLDFLTRVRKGPDTPHAEVPILMLTAHTEMHRVLAARDAGVNWVLAKPISFKSLYDALTLIVDSDREFVRSEVYIGPDRRRDRRGGSADQRRNSGNGDASDRRRAGDAPSTKEPEKS